MNLVLGINNSDLEAIIRDKKDINVLKEFKTDNNLVEDVVSLNPHAVIISNELDLNDDIMENLITQLKVNFDGKIIFFYPEEDVFTKQRINFLKSREIYHYYVGEITEDVIDYLLYGEIDKNEEVEELSQPEAEVLKNDYYEQIDAPVRTVKVTEEIEKEVIKEVIREKEIVKVKSLKQKVVTVWCDSNTTSNEVLTSFAYLLSQNYNPKTLIIDFDTLFPSLDLYFDIDKEIDVVDIYSGNIYDTSLSAMYKSIEKKILDRMVFQQLVKKHKKLKNTFLLTGLFNYEIFDLLNEEHYKEILELAKKIYDVVFIKINPAIVLESSSVALAYSDDVLMILDSNLSSVRNGIRTIKELKHNDLVRDENIKIIFDAYGKESLSKEELKFMLEGYNILGYLEHSKGRKNAVNKRKIYIKDSHKKVKAQYIDILDRLSLYSKERKKLFKRW